MAPRLQQIDWPDFGAPPVPQPAGHAELAARLARARAAMGDLDTLVVYGDREHCANLLWLTGFDPRFEEALLVLPAQGTPTLVAGNECLSWTAVSPLVAAGDIAVRHCASLSLISQPRDGERLDRLVEALVPQGSRIGSVGWKYWTEAEVADPATALEVPALLADLLRARGPTVNATALFMHPGHGLRSTVTPDQIARLEFANHMAAAALRRMTFALRPGMTDFEAFAEARVGGLPLGCHATFATGARAALGLTGPFGAVLARGQPLSFNVCHWGSNVCRAGWLAETAGDLPAPARDYVEAFAGPYLQALSGWFSMMRPGTAGGAVQAAIDAALPFETFHVALNPGHLIGDDEWISSPVFPGSDLPLRPGMAMQCDVIPSHPVYGSTRLEDGYVIADAALADDLARRHPALLERMRRRQAFMRQAVGLDVPDDCLPLADTCGVLAPFLLAPRQVLTLA
jgi:Xaa-Pro aminopeptidase